MTDSPPLPAQKTKAWKPMLPDLTREQRIALDPTWGLYLPEELRLCARDLLAQMPPLPPLSESERRALRLVEASGRKR